MKPAHFVVAAIVVAVVGILAALLHDDGGRRGGGRSATERRERGRTIAPEPPPPGDAADRAAGCRITVAVLMPDGAPAAGADILVTGADEHRGRADANGRFDVDVRPGRWSIAARKDRAVGALDVAIGEATDLGTLRLAAGHAVRGRVFDVHGEPIAGAAVEAVLVAPGEAVDWYAYAARMTEPDRVFARTRSATDGTYELLAPTGHYSLRARADGYAASIEQGRALSTDLDGVDFHLVPGRRLAGRVLGEGDRPLAAARVTMSGYIRFGDLPAKTTATTDADGRFAVVFNDSRTNRLSVHATGYAPYSETRPHFVDDLTIRLARGFSVRMRAIDARTGEPAPGALLVATHRTETRTARSDADGRAAIDRLPEVEDLQRAGLTVLVGGGAWVPRRVDLKQHRIEGGVLDLGDLELDAGATITGVVRDAAGGAPVAGARVRAFGGRMLRFAQLMEQVAQSGADGRYELRGVAPDTAAVLAVHPDYVHDIDRGELGRLMRGLGKPLLAEGQERASIDITLTPAAGVRGVVLQPDGRPAAGAHVRRRFAARGFNSMIGATEPSAFTDDSGRFELRGFRAGTTLEVVATHRAYGASQAEKAQAGQNVELALRLAAPVLLTGIVVDEQGAPVPNVKVHATPKARGRRGAFGADAIAPGLSDAQGRFALRNVGVGEIEVRLSHDAYETALVERAVDGSREVVDLGSTTLRRGNGIAGVVVDEAGRPRAGVSLNASWAGGTGPQPPAAPGPQRAGGGTTTDAAGRFAIYGLREGPYRLLLGAGTLYAERPVVRTGTTDVRLVAVEGAGFEGRVVAAAGPLEGAFVQAHVEGDGRESPDWFRSLDSARTGAGGRFRLRRLPPRAAFTLSIRHGSYRTLRVDGVTVAHSGRTFALDAGITLSGVVVEPDGTPVEHANVTVRVDGGEQTKWSRTGADGRFRFGGIEGGARFEVQVFGSAAGHTRSEPVAVKPGDTEIRIVVERGLGITATIESGREQAVFRVEVLAADGTRASETWTPPGRKFTVRGLRPGRYTLRISMRKGESIVPVTEVEDVEAGGKELNIGVD